MVPPSSEIGFTKREFEADGYRAQLREMTDEELLREGKQLHALVYPRTVSPETSVFELKLSGVSRKFPTREERP